MIILSKPFEPEELFYRIKNCYLFNKNENKINDKIFFGEFAFNLSNLQLAKK